MNSSRYKSYNVQSLDICRRYHNEIPEFLHNKPKMFIEHCLQRLPPNVNTIPSTNFSRENGIMNVESVDSNNTYIIEVGAEPKCSCKDWLNTHLPCKHLLGMFIVVEGCSWDDMPKSYTSCPHFNLDPHLKQQAMASVKQSTCTNHLENLSQCNLERVVDPISNLQDKKVFHIPSACASAIVLGQHDIHGYLINEELSNYNILIGAINESQNHWTLLAVYPMEKVLLYINPLGETDTRVRDIERKWRYFVEGRNNEGLADLSGNWKIQTVNHERQKDSTSCGIYVIKFAESLISGEDLIFNDEQGFLQDVRYGIAKQLLEVSDSLEGTCRACQNTATLTGFVNWVKCVTCEKSFHAVCVYTSSNLGSENSVFQCYICVRLKKKQPSVTNSNPKEHVVPKRKMRRPRLKKIQTNEDTMQLNSTAINSNHNAHWLFQGTNAQTTITQTLISGMCGYTLDDIDLLIKGSSSVGEETVAEMFETYVEAGLKEVMEIRNGCTEYHSPHWRHIRFVNNIPLVHHMEMRNDADGMGRRQDIFVNDSDRELNALILEAFGVFKLKTKIRVGYPHGYFLTVKMTENEKLLHNLEDVIGQNLNKGWNYFMDVLMMEAQIIIYSKMKNISLKEADKWLFPCKH